MRSNKGKNYNRNLTETHEIRSKRTSPIKRKSVNYYPDKRARHLSFKRKIDTDTILEQHANKGIRTSPIKRRRVNYKPHTNRQNNKKFSNCAAKQQNRLEKQYFPFNDHDLDDNPNNSFEIQDPNEILFEKLYLKRQERHIHLEEGDFDFNDLEDNPLMLHQK